MPTQNDDPTRPASLPAPEKFLSPLVWLGMLALVNLIGPFLPIPNLAALVLGTFGLTFGYIALVVAFALGVARRKMPIPTALAWLGVSALVWIVAQYGLVPLMREALVRSALREFQNYHQPLSMMQQLGLVAISTLQSLALFGGATFAGTMLARLIRYPNMIGPIGAAIALIDIWGVLFSGPVAQMMNNKATKHIAAQAMAVGPRMGAASAARTGFSVAVPDIGVGDFLFIALLLSVLVNLAMNWRTSARLMWSLVSLTLLAMQFVRAIPPLPGLVSIGAGAVLPNLKFFTFTREERFALLYAGIFVFLLTIGLYFGFKTVLPQQK